MGLRLYVEAQLVRGGARDDLDIRRGFIVGLHQQPSGPRSRGRLGAIYNTGNATYAERDQIAISDAPCPSDGRAMAEQPRLVSVYFSAQALGLSLAEIADVRALLG